jgi:hypothetical protein
MLTYGRESIKVNYYHVGIIMYIVTIYLNGLSFNERHFQFQILNEACIIFNANFKRKTTDKNDFRTMHNIGTDFMTGKGEKGDRGKNGRKQLGFFIKDRLIDAGLLRYGEVITEDILDMYGNHFLEFRQVPEKKDYFYITFDAA